MIETVSRDRLIELLEAGANQRIAIIGDAMLDVYLRGDVDRISPEAPVPVVRIRDKELALGGAANVAHNVAAIGARCDLVCAVGEDAEGQVIKTMLREIGSESRSVVTVQRRTTTKTRVLARSQQVVRFDEEQDTDISGDEVVGLIDAAIRAIDNADAVVLRSEEHTSELQSRRDLVCRLLLEKKKQRKTSAKPNYKGSFIRMHSLSRR